MLAKVKIFLAWPTKVHQSIFIPICFPLFDVCYVMLLPLFSFATSNYILLVPPVIIPNYFLLRVCVNVYRFSEGFISIAPSLIWCMPCMFLLLFSFTTSNYILLVTPVLILDYCHLRVCVNVYRFSEGFISIAPIAMAMGIFFNCPICAVIFFLILELQNLVLWNPAREIKPYNRY